MLLAAVWGGRLSGHCTGAQREQGAAFPGVVRGHVLPPTCMRPCPYLIPGALCSVAVAGSRVRQSRCVIRGLAVNDSRLRGARRQHRLLRERGARLDQTVHTFGWSVAGLQQGRTLLLQQKLHLAQEPSTCTRHMQRQQQCTTWALQCNTKHASLVHDKPPRACHTAPYPVNR